MKPSDTIMVSASFIEEHNKLKEENERLQWYDRIRTEDMTKLEKKLDIAVSVLKRYAITDEFEGGVGSEYEDMMWACTEALKQIKEVTNE